MQSKSFYILLYFALTCNYYRLIIFQIVENLILEQDFSTNYNKLLLQAREILNGEVGNITINKTVSLIRKYVECLIKGQYL